MAISRRALLQTGAASAVVFGAAGSWLATRTSRLARAPWEAAETGFGDPRLDALAYAILAPNPHNMQPWKIGLEGDDSFSVFADPDRLLPETDPPARQITIGFGAFLEVFRQAAAQRGFESHIVPFPEGEPWPMLDARPVARVRIQARQGLAADPLFAQVLRRRTQRMPFDTSKPVDASLIARLTRDTVDGVSVDGSTDAGLVAELRTLTRDAWKSEWENDATRRESIAVTRIGKTEVADKPWGITLDGALMSSLGALGVLSNEAMDEPGEASYDQTLRYYFDACDTAMAYLWSTTATNTRRDQLKAGAAWVRLHEAATREGLAFHPLSQALQEFPAVASHYRRAQVLLAQKGHTLQMLVRLGYAPTPPAAAPREPLESKLLPV